VPLAKALYELAETADRRPKVVAEYERKMTDTRALARLARREIRSDFPLLHGHAVVSTWSAIEAAVEDVAVAVLLYDPRAQSLDAIGRVKLSVGDFARLNEEQRARAILRDVQRSLGAEQRLGINAFEVVLTSVGFSGAVDKGVARSILELQQLRHIIVHRASVADRRFVEICPWLRTKVGQRIRITEKQFETLAIAAIAYLRIVADRVFDKYPRRPRP